jgi:hypothetical protein
MVVKGEASGGAVRRRIAQNQSRPPRYRVRGTPDFSAMRRFYPVCPAMNFLYSVGFYTPKNTAKRTISGFSKKKKAPAVSEGKSKLYLC